MNKIVDNIYIYSGYAFIHATFTDGNIHTHERKPIKSLTVFG